MVGESSGMRRARAARPVVVAAVLSFLVCGLLFPLVLTGMAQVLFPFQAGGEVASFGGHPVGSLVALNSSDYTLPGFFHARNDSASGFDPDVTLQDAYSQVPRISATTGIPSSSIVALVDAHIQSAWWTLGGPYVNVQQVNLALLAQFPSAYANLAN